MQSSCAKRYPSVLTIAGSDSIGGAGIQADIKTCAALGVYAMSAITALTAQNTLGVRAVAPTSPQMLEAQIDAVLSDIRPDAVKIGMIPDAECVRIITGKLTEYELCNLVLDPVMVATSGDALSDESVAEAMRRHLFPLATVVTPNLVEASLFAGHPIMGANEVEADNLRKALHLNALLLKGGHGFGQEITDILASEMGTRVYAHPHVDSRNTHGTGCSLSSAIAAFLAHGLPLEQACAKGVEAVAVAIEAAKDLDLGHGHGAIDHFAMEQFRLTDK